MTENMSKEDMVKEAVEEAKAKAAKEQAEAEETVETEDNIPNGTYIYFDWFTEKIHDKYGFVVRGTVYKKQIIIGLE